MDVVIDIVLVGCAVFMVDAIIDGEETVLQRVIAGLIFVWTGATIWLRLKAGL